MTDLINELMDLIIEDYDNKYTVICIARDSEDIDKNLVVFRNNKDKNNVYFKEYKEFIEEVKEKKIIFEIDAYYIPERQVINKKYKHFKGNVYTAICTVHDTDKKKYVLYGSEKQKWIRSYEIFYETIERDGEEIKRFELIDG